MASYDRFPTIKVDGFNVWRGYGPICAELAARIAQGARIVVCETYPGVYDDEVLPQLRQLGPQLIVDMRDIFKPEGVLNEQLRYYITDDRVFGRMYYGTVDDFLDPRALADARRRIQDATGPVIVYGFGASHVIPGDVVCYLDMTRWDIQLRFREGMPNYNATNNDEDNLRKYKRGYFIDWRVADKIKIELMERMDYYLDTVVPGDPKMITGDAHRAALKTAAHRPFRTVPYFDPGVWGGQWMKEVCGLDKSADNYAWSFDGVPEENEVIFDFDGVGVQVPAMNIVLGEPLALLGEQVYARFGAEWPIRFDFLDTMGGQNLSLQVHPTTEYIHRQFGMAYTQDESYYLLDAGDDACVYLGLKEGVDKDEMLAALREANGGGAPFDAELYVNKFPAKKHDHFLIPSGTIHCSGSNAMVLEISATPYIFTFKLWDWGRLGLDGKPRPVHVEHGSKVIRWDRTAKWVRDNLVNRAHEVEEPQCACTVESTGLHELEFLETRRYTFNEASHHDTAGTAHMLNLVEGEEVLVESPTGAFEPYRVHYAETFIVPASVGEYTVTPCGAASGKSAKLIKAYVRS